MSSWRTWSSAPARCRRLRAVCAACSAPTWPWPGRTISMTCSGIVEAARALVDARYAALGVMAHGGLVRFIHTGMDAHLVQEIGRLPEGKGVLGALVDHPAPVRL